MIASRGGPLRRRARQLRQAGFTLVELMVALVVSTLLVAMVLSVYMRLSAAYRGQQQLAELQQVLQAAQNMVVQDLRQTGLEMSQGFRLATDTTRIISPLQVINSNTLPDELHVFYADPSAQAYLRAGSTKTAAVVDTASTFAVGDLVAWVDVTMIANPNAVANKDADGATLAQVPQYSTCVLQISAISGTTITFSQAAPWGRAGNTHCLTGPSTANTNGAIPTMLYKFIARGYRIDPTRRAISILQMSPTGGILNDWQDLGIGFTDFQVSTRWFETAAGDIAGDTPDVDTDPKREWFSGAYQQTLTPVAGTTTAPTSYPIEATITFVIRTQRKVEGVATTATPNLVETSNANNGQVTDRPSILLNGTANATYPELLGNYVLRYSSTRVDLRNMGVGL